MCSKGVGDELKGQQVSLAPEVSQFRYSPKKMSGVASEDQLPLASQCLALCQTLASQGKAFSFTVTLGSTFTFSMDAKESAAALPKRKKKSSPSTLRRNAARREKFLNRKVEKASVVEVQCPPGISHTPVPFSAMEVERESFKCYHCGERFASNVSLMSHKRVSHTVMLHVQTPNVHCSTCGQSCSSNEDLKLHKEIAHPPIIVDPYQHLIPESWGQYLIVCFAITMYQCGYCESLYLLENQIWLLR